MSVMPNYLSITKHVYAHVCTPYCSMHTQLQLYIEQYFISIYPIEVILPYMFVFIFRSLFNLLDSLNNHTM